MLNFIFTLSSCHNETRKVSYYFTVYAYHYHFSVLCSAARSPGVRICR